MFFFFFFFVSLEEHCVWLRFVKLHENKPQDCWNNVFLTDQTTAEMFVHQADAAFQRKTPFLPVKHGGGGVMLCSHRTLTMNSSLELNVRPSL